jgi:hypothetical protein
MPSANVELPICSCHRETGSCEVSIVERTWKGRPPAGQEAWEFQNAAIRGYWRLAGTRKWHE